MSHGPDWTLKMEHRFAAAPERVFDAWLDPARAAKWFFTSPASETHQTELDARVGGKWRIADRREGVDYVALGQYVEIARPRRLVFTLGMPQFSPEFCRVTVEFATDGAGCRMTLIQEPIPPAHIEATKDGWLKMFEALESQL